MSVGTASTDFGQSRRRMLLRLRLLQLRLWSERLATSCARGLCFGLALALGGAVALVVQSGVVERSTLALVALTGLLLGLGWSLIRPPSLLSTARTADARYQLEARLGTAVELLRAQAVGRLAEAQLTDAHRALRMSRGGWPFPLLVAWKEALLAATLALALVGALRLEGRGAPLLVSLPPIAGQTSVESLERQASPETPGLAAPGSGSVQPGAKTAAAMRTLDELRRAREEGTLSREQGAGMLAQAESELNQRAAEARGQRETLDRLARALSQVSASEAAAESIQRGDYAQAGQQLAQLGQEADQLSPDAKQQLAQALRRAAAESPGNPALAERERQAAEALAGRDYQAARAALAALGDQVARAAGQSASQTELGEAMQRVQQEREASALGGAAGDRASPAGGQPSGAGQSGGSQAGQSEGSGRGQGGGVLGEGAPGQNSRPAPPDGPAEKAGSAELGPAAPRLDVVGKQVQVPVRPGGGAERSGLTEQASPEEQLVEGTQTLIDSNQPAVPVQAGGQSERIVVPGDQRQVVRDYFGKHSGRGSP